MLPTTRTCPKCEGTMHVGFLPDATYGSTVVASWHEGPPRKSFWQGTRTDKDAQKAIHAFRCEACGFVELYAP